MCNSQDNLAAQRRSDRIAIKYCIRPKLSFSRMSITFLLAESVFLKSFEVVQYYDATFRTVRTGVERREAPRGSTDSDTMLASAISRELPSQLAFCDPLTPVSNNNRIDPSHGYNTTCSPPPRRNSLALHWETYLEMLVRYVWSIPPRPGCRYTGTLPGQLYKSISPLHEITLDTRMAPFRDCERAAFTNRTPTSPNAATALVKPFPLTSALRL